VSTTTTTTATTTTPVYSSSRRVYCFGDPSYGTGGWQWEGTSNGWVRQGYSSSLSSRVAYDDSVDAMKSLGCHTIKAEIQPTDPISGGNQRAQVKIDDSNLSSFGGQPSLGIKEGQTWWYGYAFRTNPGYVPHYDSVMGNWNSIMSFHNSPINGVAGPLAPIMLEVDTLTPSNGAADWDARASLVKSATPHLGIQLNGGNQNDSNWPNEGDGQFTCHRFRGPTFVAGARYVVQFKITWGAHMNGALQVWINGTKYVDVSGISNMWYSGSVVDAGMYPIFENYRAADTSLPTNIVYYGGIIRGSTATDVDVP
jgi:Polysaccharide lyase